MNQFTYHSGRGLYINLTNRCDMNCEFCIRRGHTGVGDADSLWLDREPERQEVLDEILGQDYAAFDEIVFCGFGEPTMRLDDMLWLCDQLKKRPDMPPIRVNTNGHASLIAGRDVASRFEGRLDTVSVSLNAPSAEEYVALCHPDAGEVAFDAMLDFTKKVSAYVPHTLLSIVDVVPPETIELCRKVAESCGVPLRVRTFE